MIFSSYLFILLFFPITFCFYNLFIKCNRVTYAKIWLVLTSLYFYAYGTADFFPFFIGSIACNYIVGRSLGQTWVRQRKLIRYVLFYLGILGNIALLGYYKYMDFFITNINFFTGKDLPLKHIVLPIGISFFTFQLIAYLVDSHRGETKEYSLLNYLLFITFFPQLIVGPIVHHKEVVPQYDAILPFKIHYDTMALGIFLFSMGCAKKILLADALTSPAQMAFDNAQELNMLESWAAGVSYTLSYYFDLSGYADMAVGLGAIFNIRIPINFNSPYKSRNFAEYWRRWHITLSRFLGDYVFRNIYKKGDSGKKFYFAVMMTFLVSGFWHGSGWTFVVWGIINGIFVIWSHMMTRNNKSLPFALAWSLTFFGVIFTRILFVADSFSDALHVWLGLFDFGSLQLAGNLHIANKQPFYIALGLLIVFFMPNSLWFREKFKPNLLFSLLTALLLMAAMLQMNKVGDFLYFQF